MEKRIYIVISDSGCYDDWHDWIEGVFDDPIQAEDIKSKILAKIEYCRNIPCPIEGYDDNDFYNNEFNQKEWETIYEWMNTKQEADNFNNCVVKEYILNKPINTIV